MFGLDDFEAQPVEGEDGFMIAPAEKYGVKVVSIGFFINPTDALVWRGPMATNALKQLMHQTKWGELDYLLIDLPPGTGDVHLTVLQEMKVSGAVIVSTPQQVAIADVRRGLQMFRAEAFQIPILGIIENMAWFTPAELPYNRYYIFGHGGAEHLAEEAGVPFLGDIPIIMSVMESADAGRPASLDNPSIAEYYGKIADKIVYKPA
jgi:ATP-binding protein involved in chromosome partitioning